MSKLLQQLKQRRKELDLLQRDAALRVGMSRQQYQRLEVRGNPRLETLELIASGLNSELVLVPREKLAAVEAVLAGHMALVREGAAGYGLDTGPSLADDPWAGLLREDE